MRKKVRESDKSAFPGVTVHIYDFTAMLSIHNVRPESLILYVNYVETY